MLCIGPNDTLYGTGSSAASASASVQVNIIIVIVNILKLLIPSSLTGRGSGISGGGERVGVVGGVCV